MSSSRNPTKRELDLQHQNYELQMRLAEAEETLRAIREGEVDAVIVSGPRGEQVFSLMGTDSIYRLIVETMKEAAFTLTFDGTILFCNAQFGLFVKCQMEQIVGQSLRKFVHENDHDSAATLLTTVRNQPVKQRLVFLATDGGLVPAHISANVLNHPDNLSICVVASDLTELEASTDLIRVLREERRKLEESRAELRASNEELTRFNRAAVDREMRMIELKKEVNELRRQLGRPERYNLDFANGTTENMQSFEVEPRRR
jgi:PAS domain S-box-containing protein